MKKFPTYRGCLTIEYSPLVLRESAFCLFVFLPEVPLGVLPTMTQRMSSPKKATQMEKISQLFSNGRPAKVSINCESSSPITSIGMSSNGRKLLHLKSQPPLFSYSSLIAIRKSLFVILKSGGKLKRNNSKSKFHFRGSQMFDGELK
jgi:hypothetical protein